MVILW